MNSTGDWKIETEAESFLSQAMEKIYEACPEGKKYADYMLDKVAVRMRDILDHVTFNDSSLIPYMEAKGWISSDGKIFKNESGLFPAFVLKEGSEQVYFKVEFVEDFIKANNIETVIEGKKDSQLRKALVFKGEGVDFWAIERHGTTDFEVADTSDEKIRLARIHQQVFRSRRRQFDTVPEGFDHADELVDKAVADIGPHWACDLFLRAEREYWMTRNTAGRIQKKRQDEIGIGWANQDHHTFDSSREYFYRTIIVLEKLGFECRELFYAGAGAGWGSQVLEQPVLGSVIFADIDLSPEELDIDFAHDKNIKPLYPLRRAGLWCAMHGESMLEAGLNHLECMYDAKKLNEQFADLKIDIMQPFSDFPHLYQVLTIGEWWPVDPKRIDTLEAAGHMSPEAADNFRQFGAIGSHFENLERNAGFKGFNQPGIDDVLSIIDPRKQLLGV
ncbi:hypothetical protein [Leptobacterium sp. I13]|uniref:hypothetical protein n=1 Tax=Leptobacterium meishanense TaxID=3128904 RepID=UPI0030ECB076